MSLSGAVLEADVIISLLKFKTHGLTVLTGAIKNSFGFLPGAQKALLHKLAGNPECFHDVIVDVFRLKVPDLTIAAAIVGMEGNGPASPDLRSIGLIPASDNEVSVDAVMARMMGLDPGRLRFLQKAHEAGLGDLHFDRIEIIGRLETLTDFKVPPLGGEAVMGNKMVQDALHDRTRLRPEANRDLCTACETCVDHCPVSALSMNDSLPIVDPDTCITCFCCREVCPEKAIVLL